MPKIEYGELGLHTAAQREHRSEAQVLPAHWLALLLPQRASVKGDWAAL